MTDQQYNNMAKKKPKKGGKKKKGKKGKKKRSKIANPEERDFDFPELDQPRVKTPPTLYQSYNTLPAVDSFFGQFLIGVETDTRFDEFKPEGNKTLNLMLQQQTDMKTTSRPTTTALLSSLPAIGTPSPKKKKKAIDEDLEGIGDLEGIDDPLPTSWKQRLAATVGLHPQRKAFDRDKEVFVCNECESKVATHLCEDCGGQYFCERCAKECHRPRYRNGLLGHTVVSLQDLTEIPYLEDF